MLTFIDEILKNFESCFSRKAAFHWFVTITMGLMLRSDRLGVTSVIRDLALRPGCYETMLHFFRASSWSVAELRQRWFETVLCHAPLYKVNGLTILIGDGVTNPKARKKTLAAVRAVEAHMASSCVAMGILQMVSLLMKGEISSFKIRYIRTPSKATVSEATVMYYLRKHIFRIIAESPELSITQIIQQEQDKSGIYNDLRAS